MSKLNNLGLILAVVSLVVSLSLDTRKITDFLTLLSIGVCLVSGNLSRQKQPRARLFKERITFSSGKSAVQRIK